MHKSTVKWDKLVNEELTGILAREQDSFLLFST